MRRVFNGLIGGVLLLTALEVFTGIGLLLQYSGGADSAYSSVKQIGDSTLFSPLQGIHHWLSAALMVLGGLTILFGLCLAVYRSTRRSIWVGSILLVLAFFLLQLTGHLLPWDQHAVRTAAVETSIAQGVPGIGTLQANFLRGGSSVGPSTLMVWYWSHIAALALIIFALVGWLLGKLRKDESSSKATMTVAIIGAVGSLVLAAIYRVQLGPEATTADYGSYAALPEWYIFPLHSLLGWAQKINPSAGFLGTMVLPGIAILLMLGAPWIDQNREGKRPLYGPIFGVTLIIGTVLLCLTGNSQVAKPAGPNVYKVSSFTKPTLTKLDPALVAQGEKLFASAGCSNCHSLAGKGGNQGPALDGEGKKHPDLQWQIKHLQDPKSESPGSTMPSFNYLPADQLKAMGEYLVSLGQGQP